MIKWRNICKGYPKFIFEKFIFGLNNPLIYANLISGQISVTPDFIEKITVYSKDYVEIVFWFGDLFEKELEKELANMEGGLPYAV